MAIDIGVGTVIKLGTNTAPNNTAHGGQASDADLTAVTGIKNINIATPQGTVDITTLDSAATSRARSYIAGLLNPTGSFDFIDTAAAPLFKRLQLLRKNTASTQGIGQMDVIILYGGAVSGNLRADFTMILTEVPFNDQVEEAYGGSATLQISGGITFSAQS